MMMWGPYVNAYQRLKSHALKMLVLNHGVYGIANDCRKRFPRQDFSLLLQGVERNANSGKCLSIFPRWHRHLTASVTYDKLGLLALP